MTLKLPKVRVARGFAEEGLLVFADDRWQFWCASPNSMGIGAGGFLLERLCRLDWPAHPIFAELVAAQEYSVKRLERAA